MAIKIDNFYKKKLKNGLTVLFEKRSLPIISTIAAVNFGGGFETEKEKGIAHLIEHLLFKGTKKRSYDKLSREIEKKGGILNGYTSEEVTAFWNKLPDKHFNTSIEIASDLILNPKFDAKEFEKEKKVIIEEIKMYHDNPIYYVNEKIKELLYEKPFGMSVAGTVKTVSGITRAQVLNFFNKHYKTNKMVLCVVGNADFSSIVKKAEKLFPKNQAHFSFPKIKKHNHEIIETRKGLDQSHFVIGFHTPSLSQNKKHAYELALTYLAEGMSSVLFNEIREKRGLAYTIRPSIDIGKNYGFATIYAGTSKEHIKKIREIILKEIKALKNIKQRDFSETKEQIIGLKKVEEEDSVKVMNSLLIEETAQGAEEYYKFDDKISSVKLEEIKKISKLNKFSSLALIPE